ncbi:MAG: hypothetical protein ACI4LX_08545 [Treponema sp.]
MTKDDVQKFFINYVEERNISLMTKTEWEQLYFYCTVKSMYDKQLIELSADDLYEIAENLKIDFSKVTAFVKKCYRFEYDEVKKMTFHSLFENNAIINPVIENKIVKFCVTNSLVQERLEEIINKAGVFSDTSFKKNIFSIPATQFLTLIEKEDQPLITKLRKKKDEFCKIIKEKINGVPDSKIKKIQSLINKNDAKEALKGISYIISGIVNIINIPQNTVSEIIIQTLSDDDKVFKNLSKTLSA